MDRKKLITTAKKLLALAEAGVDGEKEVAQQKLRDFCIKHLIKQEELYDEDVFEYGIWANKEQEDFLYTLYVHVVPHTRWKFYKVRNRKARFISTYIEYVKIKDMFRHYWKKYQEELEKVERAFIIGNSLFANTDETIKWNELTDEQKREYNKLRNLGRNLQVESNFTKIGNK